MTKKQITKLAFDYHYSPSYSGKLKEWFFRVCKYSMIQPTDEQTKHLSSFGTIVVN